MLGQQLSRILQNQWPVILFWTRKPTYGRTKYHFVDGCQNRAIWGKPRRLGIPIMDLYSLRAAPRPPEIDWQRPPQELFLNPKELIGGEEPKLTRPLVRRWRKNLSTLSTFRVLRTDSRASDIWACDFFCVQTVLFHTLYVFFVVGPSGTASLSVMRQPA
jgi:hypothetical protein